MVVLSNPGTCGARKYSSWCPDIHKSKDQEYKHPKIQNSKNPKIQKSKNPKPQKSKNPKIQESKNLKIPKSKTFRTYGILPKSLDFWILIFGFLGFLDLWLCGSVDIGAPRNAFPRVVGVGGEHTCMYIYIYTYVYPICRES